MTKIFLRAFQLRKKEKKKRAKSIKAFTQYPRVLVFDTETTADEFQNLKFGSFSIYENLNLIHRGIISESKNNTKKENQILREYCKENNISLYSREEFIKKIFYNELYELESLCVGFNLPFDISRLAIRFAEGRGHSKGTFSIVLNESRYLPRIRIKHNESARYFISFAGTMNKQKRIFKGNFLDVSVLANIFCDKKRISLKKACGYFDVKHKKIETKEHGKITKEYIKYNLRDVLATYELYLALSKEYTNYGLDLDITQIYSSASLGKQALRQLGIKPFLQQQPQFSKKLLGKITSAYYGGRCECKIRKQPTEITFMDFLSMYPTTFVLMGMWKYLIAEKITYYDCTKEIQELLHKITPDSLLNQEIWKQFTVLVKIKPNGDVLPMRSKYNDKTQIANIGVNKISLNNSLFYALPDVIASKLLSGKTPIIEEAIRFTPVGKQKSLKKSTIMDIQINPTQQDFIKTLIELRQILKEKYKKTSKKYYQAKQKSTKTLANSTSYGIFLESNLTDNKEEAKIYSDEIFDSKVTNFEEIGEFFNPIIAVHLVAGSRLLLAMAEAKLQEVGLTHAYMDTDSIYVPPQHAEKLQYLFRKLNSYSFDTDILEIEKKNYWFYGISSKRYCLFRKEKNKIIIEDDNYKLHGLGHLLNPFQNNKKRWHKVVWEDFLKLHFGYMSEKEFIAKYSNFYAITKQTVTMPSLLKRFDNLNKDKALEKQIKPFNFFLIGNGTQNGIKPIVPMSQNPQSIVHSPFIDYKSGNRHCGLEHWKSLDSIFLAYLYHPESKFQNGDSNGRLERRHITDVDKSYICKEVKNLDTSTIELDLPHEIYNEEKLKEKILNMSIVERRKREIPRATHHQVKKRILNKKPLNLSNKMFNNYIKNISDKV